MNTIAKMGNLEFLQFLGIDNDAEGVNGNIIWPLLGLVWIFYMIYFCHSKICKRQATPYPMEMELPVYKWKHGEPITNITDVWTVQEIHPSAKIEIH